MDTIERNFRTTFESNKKENDDYEAAWTLEKKKLKIVLGTFDLE